MLYQVVSVRDCVHEEYQGLVLELSTASAARNFASSVISAKRSGAGLLATNAGDFALWKLGEWDSESGLYVGVQPERIISGDEVHDA